MNKKQPQTRSKLSSYFGMIKKISLVDKILITTALLGMFFFAYVFFRKADYITVTVKVGTDTLIYKEWTDYTGIRPWFADLLHKGLTQKDALGRTTNEIVSVNSYNIRPNAQIVYVKARLRGIVDRASHQYIYNGTPITIGSTLKLDFNNITFEGLVTDINGGADNRQRVKLSVETKLVEENSVYPGASGVSPEVANEIQGVHEIKDADGNIILQITQKHIENANTFAIDSNGKATVQKNPLRKDVYLTLDINALKIGDRYYLFDDVPILIGERIPLNTGKLSIFPKVIKITSAEK